MSTFSVRVKGHQKLQRILCSFEIPFPGVTEELFARIDLRPDSSRVATQQRPLALRVNTMPSSLAKKLEQQRKRRGTKTPQQREAEREARKELRKEKDRDRHFIAYRKKKLLGSDAMKTPSQIRKTRETPMTPQQESVLAKVEENE